MSSTPTATDYWNTPPPPVVEGDGCFNPVTGLYDVAISTEAYSTCESYICTVNGWTVLEYYEYCCMFNDNSYPYYTYLTVDKEDGPCEVVCMWDGYDYTWMKVDEYKKKKAKGILPQQPQMARNRKENQGKSPVFANLKH